MYKKKLLISILVTLFITSALFSADLTNDEVADALWVLTDSVGAAVAANSAEPGISLPQVGVKLAKGTGLIQKLEFSGADMARITEAMAPSDGGIVGYLSRLFSNPSRVSTNPLALVCYYNLKARGFTDGKYRLSGTIDLSFVDSNATFSSLLDAIRKGSAVGKMAEIKADVGFGGYGFSRSFKLAGDFEAGVSEQGKFYIRYPDGFKIDDKEYGSGTMTFGFDVSAL